MDTVLDDLNRPIPNVAVKPRNCLNVDGQPAEGIALHRSLTPPRLAIPATTGGPFLPSLQDGRSCAPHISLVTARIKDFLMRYLAAVESKAPMKNSGTLRAGSR
ncbi:hypothetical protein Bbelb_250540 [Branchiostoma belcheri]|nr:hypothetical protein Bbelb_250540 [Branchiostoma belcheri]